MGHPVHQPSKDGQRVGTLRERSHSYDKVTEEPATVDAALIGLDESADWSRHLLGIGKPEGFAPAEEYDDVRKTGRTTGVTNGIVFSVDSDIDVKIGEDDDGNAIRQAVSPVLVSTMPTSGGDSGSLWIRESDNKIVGLHFAGGGGLSAAIPQSALHEEFGKLTVPEESSDDRPSWLSPRRILRRLKSK
jgi:hypothetical protein